MAMGICPNCKETFCYNEYDTDYVHQCNSGNNSVDEEDFLVINKPNSNLQGLANTAPIIAKIEGGHTTTKNDLGHTKATHDTRQHYEYITLK